MGSILAETQEARRIEKLVSPLKDVFGAVFFVSVGMLLNPAVLLENLLPIAIICVVIIVGKIISVTLGAVATGQTISTSVHTGFSMAQIGEFSFIIATLGLSYDVIDERLYPIIVACSLITTFTTPYLVKVAPKTALLIENWLPSATKLLIERYITWFQRRSLSKKLGPAFYTKFLRWIANAIVVITVFALSANTLPDWFFNHFHNLALANLLSWAITLVACSPFIWGMLTISRKSSAKNSQQRLRDYPIGAGEFLSWLLTVLLLGFLSREFLSTWVSVAVTGGAAICLFFIFRKRLESYYHWLENNFIAGIEPGNHTEHDSGRSHAHLLPWEAHLIEVVVPPNSPVVGLTLQDLKIRESFGVSVVVIKRGGLDIIASKPNQTLFPHDTLLCFGSDEELDTFKAEINRVSSIEPMDRHLSQYVLRHVELPTGSPLIGKSVKQSGIREEFETMVVGIERDGIRIQNPNSDSVFKAGDLLWVVGEESSVDKLGKSKINAATIL
jgi:CPA2 family monovalent cation:H+ antiporter-2